MVDGHDVRQGVFEPLEGVDIISHHKDRNGATDRITGIPFSCTGNGFSKPADSTA